MSTHAHSYKTLIKKESLNEFMVARAEGCGKRVRESGMDMYTLLYLKCIINKDLRYSTWNSTQYYVAGWMGGESGGERVQVYEWLRPLPVHLKLSQHC